MLFVSTVNFFFSEYHSIICIYDHLFFHSYVDEHLDYFQCLSVTDKATMSIYVHSLCESLFSFTLLKNLEEEWLDPMINACVTF